MNSAKNTASLADPSPRTKARLAGLSFLLYVVTGTWGYFASQQLVSSDAAVTAANLLSNESMLRVAIAANLVAQAFYLVVIAILYNLFKPVDATVSRLAAFFQPHQLRYRIVRLPVPTRGIGRPERRTVPECFQCATARCAGAAVSNAKCSRP